MWSSSGQTKWKPLQIRPQSAETSSAGRPLSFLMNPSEERTWGLLAHIVPLAFAVTTSFGWVAALVIYLVYKDKSKFVAFHALQQVYFMLGLWLLGLLGAIMFVTVIGIPIAVVVWLFCVVSAIAWPIYAGLKANKGDWYEFPVVGRLAKTSVN